MLLISIDTSTTFIDYDSTHRRASAYSRVSFRFVRPTDNRLPFMERLAEPRNRRTLETRHLSIPYSA
jgi:hypothetical protein